MNYFIRRAVVVWFLLLDAACTEMAEPQTEVSNTEERDTSGEVDTSPDRELVVLEDVASVAVGAVHSCAVTTEGTLWCWGFNHYGQLGDGTTTTSWTPKKVEGIPEPVVQVGTGAVHTCAVTESHALYCFGNNYQWMLGIDDDCHAGEDGTCLYPTPQPVASVGNTVENVALGYDHTCVLRTDGEVRCFGDNEYGALGIGTEGYETSTLTPTPVQT